MFPGVNAPEFNQSPLISIFAPEAEASNIPVGSMVKFPSIIIVSSADKVKVSPASIVKSAKAEDTMLPIIKIIKINSNTTLRIRKTLSLSNYKVQVFNYFMLLFKFSIHNLVYKSKIINHIFTF